MKCEKNLRASSTFILVLAILTIVASIAVIFMGTSSMISFQNSTALDDSGDYEELREIMKQRENGLEQQAKSITTGMAATGALSLLAAIFNVARGLIGYKAAKGNCLNLAMGFGIAGLIGDAIAFIMSLTDGMTILVKALYLAVSCLYLQCVYTIKQKKEAEEIEQAYLAARNNGGDAGENADENKVKTIDDEAAEFFK